MKLSTLFAATVLATAGFGGAAYAQQAPVPQGDLAVPGSTTLQDNVENAEDDAVAAQPGSPVANAPAVEPGCSSPIGSSDSGDTACEEAERRSVAESATSGVDTRATGAVNEDPADNAAAAAVPGSETLQENAQAQERDAIAGQ